MKVVAPKKDDVEALGRKFLRLVPPGPHRLTLGNEREMLNEIKSLFTKYSPSPRRLISTLASDQSIWFEDQPPLYSDFLVHATTVHRDEVLGSYMFLFKTQTTIADVDVLLTPISLYRLGRGGGEFQPDLYKFGQLWYGADCEIMQLDADFVPLLEESLVHKQIVPVGPLVGNGGSTFINKLTTVRRGPLRGKDLAVRETRLPLRLPKDGFLDLDAADESFASHRPMQVLSTIFTCFVYGLDGGREVLGIYFIKSGLGECESFNMLRAYFTDLVSNRLTLSPGVSINSLISLVACRIGFCAGDCSVNETSLSFKGSSIRAVEITDFRSEPGIWKCVI